MEYTQWHSGWDSVRDGEVSFAVVVWNIIGRKGKRVLIESVVFANKKKRELSK